jgi:hypothetical protein
VFGGRSKYTDEWESITKEGHFSEEIKHFRWRWKCMAAFNPCSAKMKGLRDYDKQVARGLTINKLFQRRDAAWYLHALNSGGGLTSIGRIFTVLSAIPRSIRSSIGSREKWREKQRVDGFWI